MKEQITSVDKVCHYLSDENQIIEGNIKNIYRLINVDKMVETNLYLTESKENWDNHTNYILNIIEHNKPLNKLDENISIKTVGTIAIQEYNSVLQIKSFYIESEYRNFEIRNCTTLGSIILKRAIHICEEIMDNNKDYDRNIYLGVNTKYERLINYYKKFGFKESDDVREADGNNYIWMYYDNYSIIMEFYEKLNK